MLIDESLVRALLKSQCPSIEGVDVDTLRLASFNNGWDNDIWSLGERWLVRLPRRAAAAELVKHEQKWLPVLAPELSLPVPAPVFCGVPAGGEIAGDAAGDADVSWGVVPDGGSGTVYPWAWSVVPRFPGETAARSVLADPGQQAIRLARFLRELHHPAPTDAPVNPYRGIPVVSIAEKYAVRRDRQLDRLARDGRDVAALDRIMELGVRAPVHSGAPLMLHGDMHLGNVLISQGSLSAVVDWGDICSGDPACDLQIAWMMFDADARDVFFGSYGEGFAGLAERSKAWAAHSALVYMDNDDGDILMTLMANATLDRLLV